MKQPVFDGIQVLIDCSSGQVPSTMNNRLISRPTISPGVCRSVGPCSISNRAFCLCHVHSPFRFFVCFYCRTVLLMRKAHVSHVLHCNSAYILFCSKAKKKCRKLAFSALRKHKYMISAWRTAVRDELPSGRTHLILDPKSPVFMRVFGLPSLSKPIGKPTKSRNFWCSLTQPECSIHNAA